MASSMPVMLAWFPSSEHPHFGIPPQAQAVIETHFRILWLKDLLARPELGRNVRVVVGSMCDPVLGVVQDNLRWFPNLKLILSTARGYDHFNVGIFHENGIRVANSIAFSNATTEHAVLLLLCVARDILTIHLRSARRGTSGHHTAYTPDVRTHLIVMASSMPVMLAWFPSSEHPHFGIPPQAQAVIETHFRILWLKDLLARPELGRNVRVVVGSPRDPVLGIVKDNLHWFPNLKLILSTARGYDHFNVGLFHQKGIRVANSIAFCNATTEQAVLLLLCVARDILTNSENKHSGVPSNCHRIFEEHFRVIWLKDLLANPALGPRIQVVFGAYSDRVISTVEANLTWFPNLKVVINVSSGIEHLDVELLTRHGIRVGNCSSYSDGTAEYAVLLLLCTARDILNKVDEVRQGVECDGSMANPAPGLSGATLGVIGLGRIGTRVAKSARILDAKVLYHNRRLRDAEKDEEDGFVYTPSLNHLLSNSDYILVTCPLTEETRNLIGWEQFKLMKSSAALINVARAEIIDHEALLKALTTGELRSAALDVTDPPILPRGHPLLTLPNVIITNHCGYLTERSLISVFKEIVHNALEGLAGRPMPNEIK